MKNTLKNNKKSKERFTKSKSKKNVKKTKRNINGGVIKYKSKKDQKKKNILVGG